MANDGRDTRTDAHCLQTGCAKELARSSAALHLELSRRLLPDADPVFHLEVLNRVAMTSRWRKPRKRKFFDAAGTERTQVQLRTSIGELYDDEFGRKI